MSRSVSARRFRSPWFVTVRAARPFCRSTHNQRAVLHLLGLRRHSDSTADRHLRCTYLVVKSSRSAQYALMTAVAAVVGLLLLRAPFTAVPLTADFFSNRYTFSYLFAAVALTFLGLGYVLGRQSDRLRRLSTIDGLTGLSNRRGFDDRLQREWRRAERYGSSLALLMIDIDGLKEINDVRGHAAGDSVLCTTAIAIRQSLRSSDLGARWGGDEFAIIAPETSREAAELLGRRLLVRLKRSSGADPMVSASVGIAVFEPTQQAARRPEWLIERADGALYVAKAKGRDQIKVA
jgi:diguanylate cyclase (GGDEF)-like protein